MKKSKESPVSAEALAIFHKTREAEAAHKEAVREYGYESEETAAAHLILCVLHQLLYEANLDWAYEKYRNEMDYMEGNE